MEPLRPAREINPEAGEHWVSADPVAEAVCAAAIETSYRVFPYWQARYGDRGRAFSASDSGWLVTVAAVDSEDLAWPQIEWLAGVLAARGMPGILMEEHLGGLADELSRRRPGDPIPQALRAARQRLYQRRTRRIGESAGAALIAEFDQRTLAEGGVAGCGALILSAVCDEAHEPAAVGSLLDFLADPDRFSVGWLSAVEHTLEQGYAAITED